MRLHNEPHPRDCGWHRAGAGDLLSPQTGEESKEARTRVSWGPGWPWISISRNLPASFYIRTR